MSGDQETLPPPPHIPRVDTAGRPSKAQIDYDIRLQKNFNDKQAANQAALNAVETYLENQITSVDEDLQSARDDFLEIAEVVTNIQSETENSSAAIIELQGAFADEQDAVAGEITLINARVDDTEASIYSESLVRASGDTALGSRIDNLILTTDNDAAVIIDSEAQARISADEALGVRIDNVTAELDDVSAAVTEEVTARVTGDKAVASKVTTASVGAARVYTQDDAPSSFGRLVGDVWFDTNDEYKPYYWTGSAWVDNSTGIYKIGQIAVISNDITAIKDTEKSLVRNVTRGIASMSRVYTQDDAPTDSRQAGDVWYDTNDDYKQYVWAQINGAGSFDWRDNTSGTYKVGAIAQFETGISALVTTVGDSTTGLVEAVNNLEVTIGDANAGLINKTNILVNTVGNNSSGLVQQVNGLNSKVGDVDTGIVRDLSTLATKVGDNSSGLVKDVSSLQSTIGDTTSGLVRDISVLTDKVGDTTTGLVKDVNTLTVKTDQKRVYYQPSQPTPPDGSSFFNGDLWIDSDDNNKQYIWNGSWALSSDVRLTTIPKVYRQSSEPTGSVVGDVWFDTNNNNRSRYWNGTAWVDASDTRLGTIPAIFSQTSAPTSAGRVTGDIWFDTDDGNRQYYWNGSSWIDRSDDRLDSITKVYRQPSQPLGQVVGDLWFDTDDSNKLYYWNGSSWVNTADSRITTIKQTMQAAVDQNGAQYEWSIRGQANTVTGAITLRGAQLTNANGVTTQYSKLIIDADTTINGNLVVSGSIDTLQIANFAVSNSAGGTSPLTYATIQINLKQGDRVSIIATSSASGSGGEAFSGNLEVYADYGPGPFLVSSIGITSFVESGAVAFLFGSPYFQGSFKLPNATLLAFYQAPATGTYSFTASNVHSPRTSILVTGLRK